MASISYDTHDEWLALRKNYVGSSEIGALFGLSPWVTRWQLFQLKRGLLPDVFETKSMTAGRHFEPAVASYSAEVFGMTLRKVRRYLTCDDVAGLGSSLDYEETGNGYLAPVEIKFSLYGDDWGWEGQELTQCPDVYLLQTQAQLMCMPSAPHATLIAFAGGDIRRMTIPRNERLVTAIREAVTAFWDDVRAGREPPVDFNADADAVSRLAYLSKLRTLTMTPDQAPLFAEWKQAQADVKAAEARAEAARTQVLKALVDAGQGNDEGVRVMCGEWKVSVSKIADNAGRLVKPEDVGTYIGARKGYLRCALSKTT